jgi:leader peptidase (prepilin peptidase)/N-methyltransferase
MTVWLVVLSAVLGAVFGSFLCCFAARRAANESVLRGRSHCDACGHVLGPLDLVPVFSWLLLRGKCRYCGARIPASALWAELLLAAAFAAAAWRFGFSFETLRAFGLFCVLLPISLIDLHSYEIPDGCIIFGIAWWAATQPLMPDPWTWRLLWTVVAAFAIAGGILLLSLLMDRVLGKESLGGGDIKLFFMVSLYLGPMVGLLNLVLACLLGLVFTALRRANRIPFGPAISLASCLSLLFGRIAADWYLGLF